MKNQLNAKGVVYMNFDGGVSGKNFGASAAPTLKKLLIEISKKVNYPYTDQSLYDFWNNENEIEPRIGNLGGGSDHIAFYMHVGIPSLSGGASGPNLYHSNYDSFNFYEKFVDPEFKMGPTIEHFTGLLTLTMANAELIPYDVKRYPSDLRLHFNNASKKIMKYHRDFEGFKKTEKEIENLFSISSKLSESIKNYLELEKFSKKELKVLNQKLIALEKVLFLKTACILVPGINHFMPLQIHLVVMLRGYYLVLNMK